MRIMVIPEDPVNDQHVLKPLVRAIARSAGLANPRVEVLQNPRLRSVTEALDPARLRDLYNQFGAMYKLFVLAVDRDGERTRQAAVDDRIGDAEGRGVTLLGCLAIEEVEVWVLALHADDLRKERGWAWPDIRAERDPKERYFEPFVASRGWQTLLGRGRAKAMEALDSQGLQQVTARCPELGDLRSQLEVWRDKDATIAG